MGAPDLSRWPTQDTVLPKGTAILEADPEVHSCLAGHGVQGGRRCQAGGSEGLHLGTRGKL